MYELKKGGENKSYLYKLLPTRYGVFYMATVKTTLMLDDMIANKVRQLFDGNLSRGVNELLHKHLFEEKKESMWGALKGRASAKDLLEDREKDEKALEEHWKHFKK